MQQQESLQHTLGRIDEHLTNSDNRMSAGFSQIYERLDRLERKNGNMSPKTWAMILGSIVAVSAPISAVAVALIK